MENSQVGEAQPLMGRYGVKIWTSDKMVAPVNLSNGILLIFAKKWGVEKIYLGQNNTR